MAHALRLTLIICFVQYFISNTHGQGDCGGVTTDKEYTFRNPSTYVHECTFRVYVTDSKVSQLRLDFNTFSIAQPEKDSFLLSSYQCMRDSFSVESLPGNAGDHGRKLFGEICGENKGQHVYVPVNASKSHETIQLTFVLEQPLEKGQEWSIKITQLDCNDAYDKELCAPEGCLQYYPDPSGIFESFNYGNGAGHYPGLLYYAICFKRYSNHCAILYNGVGFQLPSNDFVNQYGNEGCNLATIIAGDPYSRDFLFIPNAISATGVESSLWCGTSLLNNDTTTVAPGPLYVLFRSDEYANEVVNGEEIGFQIRYQTQQCNSMQ